MQFFSRSFLFKNSGLPSAYQEVEWIKSTGTQYIDTGVSGSAIGEYEIKMDTLGQTAIPYEQYFAGDRLVTNRVPKIFGNTTLSIQGGDGNGGFETTFSGLHEIKIRTTGMTDNGVVMDTYGGCQWGTLTFYIFNAHGEPNLKSSMKLYYLKMYSDGTLIRNFVPCYHKSDNIIGLYDTINGIFYTNQGSGEFEKGPII